MTGRELHEALRAGGVFEVGSVMVGPEGGFAVGLAEPYNALAGKQRDALDRAAARLDVYPAIEALIAQGKVDVESIRAALERAASYPSNVESPIDPPTVSGTSVTKDVGR